MQINSTHISQGFESELINVKIEQKEDILHFLDFWFGNEESISVNTSGSTGKPKPILLSKKDLIESAKLTLNFFNLKPTDSALLCLPIKFIAGKLMLVRSLIGNLNLITTPLSLRPIKDLNHSIDFAAMTPAQVEQSLKYDRNKFNLIKTLIIGGGSVSNELEKALKEIPTECYSTFGMTETVTHIALKKLNNDNLFEAIGDVTFELNNQNCLTINTPHLSTKIHHTKDIAQLIDSKHFIYLGRADNVINSGGIKIYPEIIERKLERIVSNRFYISKKKHSTLGEQVVLVIEGEHSISTDLISKYIEKYEVPKEIITINQFKETPTGKIIREIK